MPAQPTCLHSDILYETRPARLVWSETGADGYELDAVFDKSFTDVGPYGLSWRGVYISDKPWRNLSAADPSWDELSSYYNPEAALRGINWNYILYSDENWLRLALSNLSWADFNDLPASYIIYSGPGTGLGNSYEGLEHLRSWDKLNAPDKSWFELAAIDPSWYSIERRELGASPHVFFETVIPRGKKFAYFRVRGYQDQNGVKLYSPWLESDEIPILPYLIKNGELVFDSVAGAKYDVQLNFSDVLDEFETATIELRYDPERLFLTGFAPLDQNADFTGRIRVTVPQIISQTAGIIIIKCEKSEPDCRNGLAALLRFTALADGETSIIMS
jgi:hypothetical protein